MKRLGLRSFGPLFLCACLVTACDTHSAQRPGPVVGNDYPHNEEAGADTPRQVPTDTPSPAPGATDYDWRSEAQMADVPAQSFTGENYGSHYYQDIMSHTKPDYFDEPATSAHETLHGLHSDMRQKTAAKDGFVYYGNGKGLYIVEPKDTLADVKNYVGPSFQQLAKTNYDMYLVKQLQYWKNAIYLFDEWTCYIATARTAIEAQMAGKWTAQFAASHTDPIEGLVTMMYFNSAAILSIKKADPEYVKTNKQYKAAYAMTMEESAYLVNHARNTPYWAKSRAYGKLENLQTAADAAPVRAAIKELMGDAWAKRVLGI